MAAKSAYKCTVECSFHNEGQSYPIEANFIKYIIIENQYQTNQYMPVIYLSLAVNAEIYNLLLTKKKTGKFYLRLQKQNIYSVAGLDKRYIEGEFSYIPSSSNPNYSQDIAESVGVDMTYRTITVALMSMEILNKTKTSFNGIYGNIDQATLIVKTMEGLDAVVKPPLYNPVYETIMIPAMNTRAKLINFLYQKCPLYDTNYMFFVDFNQAYLVDLSGDYCPANDGQLSTVMFDIKQVTVSTSYNEGIEIRDGAYYLNINPANTNVVENTGQDKVSNQMVFIEDDGVIDYVDLDINNAEDSELKQSFNRGGNAILYKNMAESNTVIIELMKENMDGSLFTPNKEYYINNYEDFSQYNGKYTLLYKKEVIVNTNGTFGVATSLGLRKVGNITSIGAAVAVKATKKAASGSHSYAKSPYSTSVKSSSGRTSNSGGVASGRGASAINLLNTSTPTIPLPTVKRVKASSPNSTLKRSANKIDQG